MAGRCPTFDRATPRDTNLCVVCRGKVNSIAPASCVWSKCVTNLSFGTFGVRGYDEASRAEQRRYARVTMSEANLGVLQWSQAEVVDLTGARQDYVHRERSATHCTAYSSYSYAYPPRCSDAFRPSHHKTSRLNPSSRRRYSSSLGAGRTKRFALSQPAQHLHSPSAPADLLDDDPTRERISRQTIFIAQRP